MLRLENITKDYKTGDTVTPALRGVSITFRENEFVSVLGPSGCGKTTLLNIIGGLDIYTSGDFVINGKPTAKFAASDWDTYRNHTVGFVFQSYNLIPHQSVLQNVELALTLSGVGKAERRRRAVEALEKVGLGDQIKKRPNQLSGGQMQRVAIARALVNDPDILLADEPTGALDSETSVQIMEILRSIAKDKLIIMVTHNPELAEEYSSRIIRLLDGRVVSDSAPYAAEPEPLPTGKPPKKPSMSMRTALGLSLNNLMTKKGRTILTAFAGSIGIIGIALILSLSSGFQNYIDRVQKDTLSSYPIMIQKETVDLTSMMVSMMGNMETDETREPGRIYSTDVMSEMVNTLSQEVQTNDLEAFKAYIEKEETGMEELVSAISYTYSVPLNIYSSDTSKGALQVNPSQILKAMYGEQYEQMADAFSQSGANVWNELLENDALIESQYEVLAGRLPEAWNEVVLIIGRNFEISDMALYSLGLRDPAELEEMMAAAMKGEPYETEEVSFTYEEVLDITFRLLPKTSLYVYDETAKVWKDMSRDEVFLKAAVESAEVLRVVGLACPAENASISNTYGSIGYTAELTRHLIEAVNNSAVVKAQLDAPEKDIFTGIDFDAGKTEFVPTMADVQAYLATLPVAEQHKMQAYFSTMTEDQILALFAQNMKPETTDATYDGNLELLGYTDIEKPSGINIYPVDFESKEQIEEIITQYNNMVTDADEPEKVINYTDYIGLLLSSVSNIINAISYVLIAFVAISLVVSSIMIGIITYISVLERTKEIGILRAIGASRRDIARVFNAETMLEGLTSGAIGIGVTLLLLIPANLIIDALAGIGAIAALPWQGAVVLVIISIMLTLIAGLVPSRMAARKDPVEALRTE
ncbi:MAG: ABC transporter ATP-binding protein/permease [Clostridia bacterium]|nr:ABC transporter ATP-binding protein/permease [Clostridia bacterium]